MADTLIIGGKTYSNVTGIKATDDNEIIQIYSKGGGGTDVEDSIITRTISGSYTNSRVTKVGRYAFASCYNLTTVSFPACTLIGDSAFWSCKSLTTASFPVCTSIGSSAFYGCDKLATISFPVCTNISMYAFQYCYSLTAVNFPACTSMGDYTFSNCSNLTTASFPVCTSIGNLAFRYCSKLTTVSFPVCTTIGTGAFQACRTLSTISFSVCTLINGTNNFSSCYNLLSVYFLGSSVPILSNSNAFTSTPIAGYTTSTGGVYGSIYVRASLLTEFQTATNWTYFSSRMVGLTDAQIAAL